MRSKHIFGRLTLLLLSLMMIAGLCAAMPAAAYADNATNLANTINGFTHGGTGTLSSSVTGANEVTVTSTGVTGVTATLALDIDPGVTVKWAADYSGATASNLISLGTTGTFEVTGGSIKNTNISGGSAIYSTGDVVVSGGTVSAASGSAAIRAEGVSSDITVSGSSTRVENTDDGNAIDVNGSSGEVKIEGGTVSAGDGNAIYSSIGDVTVSGGLVESGTGNAIYTHNASCTVTVSGGTVTSATTDATISATGNVEVSQPTTTPTVVENTGTGRAISTGDAVTVSGGTVSNTSNDPTISASEDITVSGSNTVIKNEGTGDAIYIDSVNADVEISSGTVSAATGRAINANGDVKVSGGTVKSEGTSAGIEAGNGEVELNGGYVVAAEINVGGGATQPVNGALAELYPVTITGLPNGSYANPVGTGNPGFIMDDTKAAGTGYNKAWMPEATLQTYTVGGYTATGVITSTGPNTLNFTAASGNVCAIGATEYATLHEAVAAVSNTQTITFLQNVTDDFFISVNGKTFTINTNGYSFMLDDMVMNVFNSGHVTINGDLQLNEAEISIENGGKITVKGSVNVTETDPSLDHVNIYCDGSGSTITITGNVTTTQRGVNASGGGVINIDGNITAGGTGVSVLSGGQVTVDGTINATKYININGTIKVAGDGVPDSSNPGYLKYSDGNATVWVGTSNVCAIGSTEYASLDLALAAVPSGGTATIKMLANILTERVLIDNKKITLDLNGKTLTINRPDISYNGLSITNGGELYTTGAGALNITGAGNGLGVNSGCKATITGNISTNGPSAVTARPNSVVIINGDIETGGTVTADQGNLTINGNVTVSGTHSNIYSNGTGARLYINGNVVKEGVSVITPVTCSSEAYLEITGNVTANDPNNTSDSAIACGNENSEVFIGGNITSSVTGVRVWDRGQVTVDGTITAAKYVDIYGTVKVATDGVTDIAKPGYLKYSNTTGDTSTVWVLDTSAGNVCQIVATGNMYPTLTAALAAAQNNTATVIKLLKNITEPYNLELHYKFVTFNLNGKLLTLDGGIELYDCQIDYANPGATGGFIVNKYGSFSNSTCAITCFESSVAESGYTTVFNGTNSSVTINGNMTLGGARAGARMADNSSLTINGDVLIKNANANLQIEDNSSLTMTGNITVTNPTLPLPWNLPSHAAVFCSDGSTAVINGNITTPNFGIDVYQGSTMTVNGNINAGRTGVCVNDNSNAIVDGTVVAATPPSSYYYMIVDNYDFNVSGGVPSTSKPGFTEYKYNTSTAWVRDSSTPATVTSVTVNPSTATVQKGATHQFSAVVNGNNNPSQSVTWSVNSTAGSTISASGLLSVAASETAATLTVKATSTANNTKSGVATVTVSSTPPPPATITGVTVTPSATSVQKGTTRQFSATVQGTNSPSQSVTWSVTGSNSGSSISAGGVLSVAANETAATLTVRATSTANNTKSGTATVTVTQTATGTSYYIIFDAQGGTVNPAAMQTDSNGKLTLLPLPTRYGVIFLGWYTHATGGTRITSNYVFTASTTVYARWQNPGSSIGGSSSGGGGGAPSVSVTVPQPVITNGTVTVNGVTVPYTMNQTTGTMSINLTASLMDQLLAAAGGANPIVLNMGGPAGMSAINIVFAPAWFTAHPDISFSIQTAIGGFNLNHIVARNFPPDKATSRISLYKGSIILAAEQDDEVITWNNPAAPIKLYMVYTPEEDADTTAIVLFDKASGKVITNSFYEDGKVYGSVNGPGEYDAKVVSTGFTDTANHWAQNSVTFMAARGLMSGSGESTFSPNATITRAMLLTVLARMAGADTEGGETWYSKAVEWAIAEGISDGSNPNSPVTREQLATMLQRYANLPVPSVPTQFADSVGISDYAQEAVSAMQAAGIITGKPGNNFDPQGIATRAEVASMLYRFLTTVE